VNRRNGLIFGKIPSRILKKVPLYFLPPFLIGGLIIFILHSSEVGEEIHITKTRETLHMDLHFKEISHQMRDITSDTKILAAHHEVEAALKSSDFPDLEPLTKEFAAFSEAKGAYEKIRLINLSGKELVSVSYAHEQVVILPPGALRNIGHSGYFNKIIDMDRGEIYLSETKFKRVNSNIEQPLKPVMHVGMPLFDHEGNKQGVVVLNYLPEKIFRYLGQNPISGAVKYLLLGSDEFWVQGTEEESWTFTYLQEGKPSFREQYPVIWEDISGKKTGQFFTDQGLVTFMTVYPRLEAMKELSSQAMRHMDPEMESLSWTLVSVVPEQMLFVGSTKKLNRYFLFYGLFSFVLGLSALALARMSSRHELTEEALSISEAQHRQLVETTPHGILEIDLSGNILFGNSAYHKMLGYDERALIGKTVWGLIQKKDRREAISALEKRIMQLPLPKAHIGRYIRKDGRIIDIEEAWNYKRDGRAQVVGFVSVITDITERKRSEARQRLAATIFETANEGIVVTDAKANIISINPAFTEITGYSLEEVIGKNPRLLRSSRSGRHDAAFYQAMWESINITGHWQGEIWNRKKNGEVYPEWLSITTVRDKGGKVVQYTGLFTDITQRKEFEERLRFQAYYDPLTRLPNRMLLFDRLRQGIRQARRNQKKAALLFVDLDGFKNVNDTLGHHAGDAILKEAAGRLLASVRKTDTVARSGGDEFVVVLPDIVGGKDAAVAAEKIIASQAGPFLYEGQEAFVGASIGITMIPDDSEETSVLFKNADMAMYKAKAEGRNTYRFFSRKMGKLVHARTHLEWDLRRALENRELLIHYQPIIDLSSYKTRSLEALVRWQHPIQGFLLPEKFIVMAEESDLIIEIGNWTLQKACSQLAQWQNRFGVKNSVSVNMSSRQFMYDDFFSKITHALEESGLPPEFLTIEITEGLMLDPIKDVMKKLWMLKELGVKLSIDDFGTGYSSLSYLSKYPLNLLKIDKSFILNVCSDMQKQSLVDAMIRMGHSMALQVIAEGVETYDDLLYLRDKECDAVQGYYFSKALPVSEYEAVLEKQRKGAA